MNVMLYRGHMNSHILLINTVMIAGRSLLSGVSTGYHRLKLGRGISGDSKPQVLDQSVLMKLCIDNNTVQGHSSSTGDMNVWLVRICF